MNTESAIVWLAQYKSSAISCRGCLSESTGGEPIDERLGDDAIRAARIERALRTGLDKMNELPFFDCLLCAKCGNRKCNRGLYARFASPRLHGLWLMSMVRGFKLGSLEWSRIMHGDVLHYRNGNPCFTRQNDHRK